jgi:hypothetical protein
VGVGENRSRGGFTDYAEIDRPVNSQEMDTLLSYAKQLGMKRHFTSSFYFIICQIEPAKFGIFSPLPCI